MLGLKLKYALMHPVSEECTKGEEFTSPHTPCFPQAPHWVDPYLYVQVLLQRLKLTGHMK